MLIEIENGSVLVFSKKSENAIASIFLLLVISIANGTLNESSNETWNETWNETLEERIFFLIDVLEISIVIVFSLLTFLVYANLNANVFVFLYATSRASEFVFFVVDFRASQICYDGVGDDPDFSICFFVYLYLNLLVDLLFSWILEIFGLLSQTEHQ